MTTEEEITMCLNCPKEACDNCLGCSTKGLGSRKGWEKWQDEYLLSHPTARLDHISEVTGKSISCVKARRIKFGMPKRHFTKYSKADKDFILTHSIDECVRRLGRSRNSIIVQRSILKNDKSYKRGTD